MKRALKKGVKIQILTEVPEDGDNLPRIIEESTLPGKLLELKYTSELPSHYVVVDGTEMMFSTSTKDDADNSSLDEQSQLSCTHSEKLRRLVANINELEQNRSGSYL